MAWKIDDEALYREQGEHWIRVTLYKPARGGWLVKDAAGEPYWADSDDLASVVVKLDESNVLEVVRGLSAEMKIKVIIAMGFSPVGGDHDATCSAMGDFDDEDEPSGLRCNCVPPATSWSQPGDVDEHRHETWNERRALAFQWEREGSHGRSK